MKKVFWDNPYQRNLTTIISSLSGDRILLEETIAFSFSGFSKVPCGGTHVKSTAEVGFVTLKRVNIGGGKERIEIRLIDDKVGLE